MENSIQRQQRLAKNRARRYRERRKWRHNILQDLNSAMQVVDEAHEVEDMNSSNAEESEDEAHEVEDMNSSNAEESEDEAHEVEDMNSSNGGRWSNMNICNGGIV